MKGPVEATDADSGQRHVLRLGLGRGRFAIEAASQLSDGAVAALFQHFLDGETESVCHDAAVGGSVPALGNRRRT
jgi:hypothetical protein